MATRKKKATLIPCDLASNFLQLPAGGFCGGERLEPLVGLLSPRQAKAAQNLLASILSNYYSKKALRPMRKDLQTDLRIVRRANNRILKACNAYKGMWSGLFCADCPMDSFIAGGPDPSLIDRELATRLAAVQEIVETIADLYEAPLKQLKDAIDDPDRSRSLNMPGVFAVAANAVVKAALPRANRKTVSSRIDAFIADNSKWFFGISARATALSRIRKARHDVLKSRFLQSVFISHDRLLFPALP